MNKISVTYFSSFKDKNTKVQYLNDVLLDFKNGVYKELILNVRANLLKGKYVYSQAKKNLPAIAFCGEFKGGHSKSNLVHYNNLLVFDIDNLLKENMSSIRSVLSADKYVLSLWESPSGLGYKGLIRIDYKELSDDLDSCYKKAFECVDSYFMEQYNVEIDKSCSDFSRICYVCWDEKLYLNMSAQCFIVDCTNLCTYKKKNIVTRYTQYKSKHRLGVSTPVNVQGRNNQLNRKIIASIIKYLKKRNLSITYSYDEWLRVGFAIANTFNYDLGLKYFIELSCLDKQKFNKEECVDKLLECYNKGTGEVTFGTIVDMAQKKGYRFKGSSEDS